LKDLNTGTKDNVRLNPIPHNEWRQFYKDLWTDEEQDLFPTALNDGNIDPIILDELSALTQFKNKKAPGSDEINIELLKEAPLTLLIRLLDLITTCWRTGHAPEEWNIVVVTPTHKKGSRNYCSNYQGISLLNSCYKIHSKILHNRISKIAENIILNIIY
jgi:hypothetical protein